MSDNFPSFTPSRRDFLKVTGLSAAALAGIPALAACGSDNENAGVAYISQDTTDPEIAAYDKWNAAFTKANDGLEATGQHLGAGTDFLTKLEAGLAAGNPPDLVTRWFSDEARTYWNRDSIAPATELLEQIAPLENWDETAISAFTVDGTLIGIPLDVSVFPFFWRKDLLEAANLQVPETWDDLLTAAEKLTVDGMHGTVVPHARSTQISYIFWIMLWSNGGCVVDPALNVALDTPEVVETLNFLKELAQFSPPGSAQFDWGDNIGSFVSGKSASVLYQGRVLANIEDQNPDLRDAITVGMVPYGKQPATLGLWSGSSIPAAAENPEGAEAYIKMMHSPEHYASWLNVAPGHNWAADVTMMDNDTVQADPIVNHYSDIIDEIRAMSEFARSFAQESSDHEVNYNAASFLNSNVLADMVQRVLINDEDASSVARWGAEQATAIMER